VISFTDGHPDRHRTGQQAVGAFEVADVSQGLHVFRTLVHLGPDKQWTAKVSHFESRETHGAL